MFFNLKEVHCGNLKIFLLLRFYLISNLGEFRSCKIAILCNLRGPYFCEFGKIQPSKIAKIHQNQHSKPLTQYLANVSTGHENYQRIPINPR